MSLAPTTGLQPPPTGRPEHRGAYGRAHLTRLFRLVLLLQSGRYPNARELAERCEVSRRTVYRDLTLLAESGIPVRYRPERQGYHLAKGFFLPPTNLEEAEALALLALARQWACGYGLGLMRHAWSGAVKLVQGLTPEVRDRVLAAAEPFGADPAPRCGSTTDVRGDVHEGILASLSQLRQIRLWYRDRHTLSDECTKFSLYRLLVHDRHWFMVGRSTLHRRVEVIGVPWVQRVTLTDDRYDIPPRFNLERFLAQAWGVERGASRYDVRLRFSPRLVPELSDTPWRRGVRRLDLADGRVELLLTVDGVEEILRWVLGFGDQVEVLSPPRLRERLHEVSANVARAHLPRPAQAGGPGCGVGG
jgi:predicted DNA-binding transcriptional regulator YafY